MRQRFDPPLVDDFNRADSASLGNASVTGEAWVVPGLDGRPGMEIKNNMIQGDHTQALFNAYAAALTDDRGPNVQIAAKIGVLSGANSPAVVLNARLHDLGLGTEDVYSVHVNPTQFWVTEYIDTVDTTITPDVGSVSLTFAVGDLWGMEIVELASSTLITVVTNTAGAGWVARASYVRSTAGRATAAGKVGLHTLNDPAGASIDDFRARTIPAIVAQRFYLPSVGAVPAGLTPAFESLWEKTNEADRMMMMRNKTGSAMTSITRTANGVTGTETLARQYISDPMPAGLLLHGHLKGQIRVLETLATANEATVTVLKVVSSTGTLRQVLHTSTLSGNSSGAAPEWSTSLTNRKMPRAWASPGALITPYVTQEGDRLVLELGFGQISTVATAQTLRVGDAAAADLAEDDTSTTDNNPWIELLVGCEFIPKPDPNIMSQALHRASRW